MERIAECIEPAPSTQVVILSPHLDDAVLSIGAWIARAAKQGRKIEVWTVFTGAPPAERVRAEHRVFADYVLRRAEDERALSRLGAIPRAVGLLERIWRDPPLGTVWKLFSTPPDAEAFVNMGPLQQLIAGLLDRPELRVYAPLGVGNHIDHVELALAAMHVLLARRAFTQLSFYEDFYAASGGARRRHFVAREHTFGVWQAPLWAAPKLGCALGLSASVARGPGLEKYLPGLSSLRWTSVATPVGECEQEKLAAVAEYGSQLALMGGIARFGPFLSAAHRVLGGERIWQAAGR